MCPCDGTRASEIKSLKLYRTLSIRARLSWPLYSVNPGDKILQVGEGVSRTVLICHQHNAGKTINTKFEQEPKQASWSFRRLPNGFPTTAAQSVSEYDLVNTQISRK